MRVWRWKLGSVAVVTASLIAGQVFPLAAGGMQGGPAGSQGDGPARQAEDGSRYTVSRHVYSIPDVMLVDAQGSTVSLRTELSRPGPVMLQFIFTTCPAVCPMLSSGFSSARNLLDLELEQFRLLSITIDPEHDTPARLREYAAAFEAEPYWQFLTGSRQNVIAVQKAFDSYQENKMQHQALTFLRQAPGEPWLRLEGMLSGAQLVTEYRRLEAPQP